MKKSTSPALRRPDVTKPIDRMLIMTTMLNMNVLPLEFINHDMRRVLAQLPVDVARTMRRKFRKLWRREVKKDGPRAQASHVGLGKQVPSRNERNERKRLVFEALWHDVIGPLVMKVENAGSSVDETDGRQ